MESGSRAVDERRGAADGWTATDGLALDRRRVSRVSSRSSLRRDAVGRRLLVAADVSAAAIALLIFVPLLGYDTLALTTLAGLPIVVLMSKLSGLYDRDDLLLRKTTLEEVPSLFGLATV